MTGMGTPQVLIDRIQREFVLGGHKAAAVAGLLARVDVYLVSEFPDEVVRSMCMTPFATVDEALCGGPDPARAPAPAASWCRTAAASRPAADLGRLAPFSLWGSRYERAASATRLRSTPMPSTSTSTTSPCFIESLGSRNTPTPSGVPVRMRSPGSSVSACEMNATSVAHVEDELGSCASPAASRR